MSNVEVIVTENILKLVEDGISIPKLAVMWIPYCGSVTSFVTTSIQGCIKQRAFYHCDGVYDWRGYRYEFIRWENG